MGLLDDFDESEALFHDFSPKLNTLLHELLSVGRLRVHSVSTRVKSPESFEKKVGKASGKYVELSQIADLCGARIITYFEDEVEAISALIEHEFEIDRLNSVDKGRTYDADRFGYLSVHYVAKLKGPRAGLAEYKRFERIAFEIQVRSILQHAWAEIEHDLQYKSQESVPRPLRRRFARLAGLLELADAEFMGIRDQIEQYQQTLPKAIEMAPGEVLVDRDSLTTFVLDSPTVTDVDRRIAEILNVPLTRTTIDLEFILGAFNILGLQTIDSVQSALSSTAGNVVRFADLFINRPDSDRSAPITSFNRGISLFYAAYYKILEVYPSMKVAEVLDTIGFNPKIGNQELARQLHKAFSSM